MPAPIPLDARKRLAIETAAYHARNRAWRPPEPPPIDWSDVTPLPDDAPQFWRDAPAEWLFRGERAYRDHLRGGRP